MGPQIFSCLDFEAVILAEFSRHDIARSDMNCIMHGSLESLTLTVETPATFV